MISLSFHSGHINTHIFPLLRKHIGHIFTSTLTRATQMTVNIYSQFKYPGEFPLPSPTTLRQLGCFHSVVVVAVVVVVNTLGGQR